MKIYVCSDLHIDRLSAQQYQDFSLPKADIYLIAGDLMNGVIERHYHWLLDKTQGVPTYICPGNHDFYGTQRPLALAEMRRLVKQTHIQIVCDQGLQIAPGLFLWASDFWTDMQIAGEVDAVEAIAYSHWHDFNVIEIEQQGKLRLLEPQDTRYWHQASLARYLDFAAQCQGQIILMTHHGVVCESLVRDLKQSPLTAEDGFRSSDLYRRIVAAEHPPLLLINGHIHDYNQLRLSDESYLLCNPRGNDGELRPTLVELSRQQQRYQLKFVE